jgi:hypothetical protein
LTIGVSVRWAIVLLGASVNYCLKLKEVRMDSIMETFMSVVLLGSALLPVSG